MLLELDMRLSVILLLLTASVGLTGCDRASSPTEQAEGEVVVAPAPKEKLPENGTADIGLVSANGLKATLSYAHAGSAAPEVSFKGADGRELSLANFAGRPLLVNIWATWCVPCKAEMPTLDALASIEQGKLSVIAISQDLQGRKPVREFFDRAGIQNLEPYIDRQNRMSAAFDNQLALPATILYDSEGREVWRVIGGVEWDDEEMASLLDEAS